MSPNSPQQMKDIILPFLSPIPLLSECYIGEQEPQPNLK